MTSFLPLIAALALAGPSLIAPASAAPAPPPETVIDAALAEAECLYGYADVRAQIEPPRALDDALMLLEIPCWMAAYQAGSILMAYDPDVPEEARLLRFPVPDADGLTDQPSLTFPDYDPETRQITSLHRSRGLGDCGTAGRWQWTGEAFTLESYWDKPDCDGELFDPFSAPEAWRVYP